MTYEETINYLYNAAPAFEKVGAGAYKEGLSNTLTLDNHFSHPHRHYKTIHVAGTNGKGSTSHTLAAILQSQGMKVGLYTSPHLIDFRERIRVNGIMIPKERVIRFVEEEKNFFEPLQPSFFELTTALALLYFAEQKIDVAVIEVGLGGRLDCTNIISPVLSIITNISFDHTQFLGDTLQKIAAEKAGIIKSTTPCLIGEYTTETKQVFLNKAEEVGCPMIRFAEDHPMKTTHHFELKGSYQQRNLNTILNAVDMLRSILTPISDVALRSGLEHVCSLTGLMGRWQTLSHRPLTICDTGHNLAGWQYLAPQIKEQCKELKALSEKSTLRMVFGMVDDKDINAVMDLLPRNATFYFCQASTHRAIPAEKVLNIAKKHGLNGHTFTSVSKAYQHAINEASTSDFIFIGGSSYVVADLLTSLQHAI